MREVAVQLQDPLGAFRERPPKPCEIGGPEPFLTGPVEDVDIVELSGESIC